MSMDDSSNGRVVALYLADPGSNPGSGSVWDHFVSATHILSSICICISIKYGHIIKIKTT